MNSQELDQAISELDVELDRVRALYEQYFIGIEKLEPQIPLKNFERKLQMIRRERIHNTALRFRFQQILQRYNTMQTYWRRVSRQIEEGTYRPDVMKARAKAEKRRAEVRARIEAERQRQDGLLPATTHEVDPDDLDGEDTDPNMSLPDFGQGVGAPAPDEGMSYASAGGTREVVATVPVQPFPSSSPFALPPSSSPFASPPPYTAPPAARRRTSSVVRVGQPSSPSASSNGQDEGRFQKIYTDYVTARERCNQSTAGLSYEKMTAQLRKQETELREKHGKEVDFVVKVRDGRAVLRAVRKGEN
jgi:hypothetical protein